MFARCAQMSCYETGIDKGEACPNCGWLRPAKGDGGGGHRGGRALGGAGTSDNDGPATGDNSGSAAGKNSDAGAADDKSL